MVITSAFIFKQEEKHRQTALDMNLSLLWADKTISFWYLLIKCFFCDNHLGRKVQGNTSKLLCLTRLPDRSVSGINEKKKIIYVMCHSTTTPPGQLSSLAFSPLSSAGRATLHLNEGNDELLAYNCIEFNIRF